jgi:xanthine dehydrogenase small subunit
LCRCTGYGPLLVAGETIPTAARDDRETIATLATLRRVETVVGRYTDPLSDTLRQWYVPRTVDDLAALLMEHPGARLVAGATDVGLWVTKQQRVLDTLIFVGDVAELATIEETSDGLRLGAGVRYADAAEALARLHPDLGELVRRIGGPQVRNAGTIGGNVANGSPIGDTPPALIALGATLTMRMGTERRTLPLEDYFLAYGRQDRAPGEFVESLFVPRPSPTAKVAISKLSKRFDSDISAVLGAFTIDLDGDRVRDARLAFGGMAATPKRALQAERALIGRRWSEAAIEAAAAALADDFSPLSDVRGSSGYRLRVAANLLRRMWLAEAGETVSVLELADG